MKNETSREDILKAMAELVEWMRWNTGPKDSCAAMLITAAEIVDSEGVVGVYAPK